MKKSIVILSALILVFVLALTGCEFLDSFHECEDACPICGKCLETDCNIAGCKDKCPGNHPIEHACESVCSECGKCLDAECGESACADKCQGHKNPDEEPEHVCAESLTKTDAVAATCVADGCAEYYTCSCGKIYSDAEAKNETTVEDSAIAALGHDEQSHEAKAPTCTEGGYDAYVTCSRCDYTTYAGKEALGHDEQSHEAKAPTCTEGGYDAYVTCSRCDYTTYADKAALGHDYEWVVDTQPTFSATGVKHEECTRCNDKRNENTEIPVKECNHELIKTNAVQATCLTAGNKAYYTCSICGKIYSNEEGTLETTVENSVIAALGHDEQKHNAKAPTCTEGGYDAYVTCSRCDYTTYADKAALGHDEQSHDAKAPTCTEKGHDAYVTCSRCDYTTYVEKAALGHDEQSHDAKAPTCTEKGHDAYVTCSRCDYTTYAEKAALGHKDEDNNFKCDVCNNDLCTEHAPSEPIKENEVAATCKANGSYDNVVKCANCGKELSRTTVTVDKLGHTEEAVPGYAATCENAGLTDGKKCSVCGETLVAQESIPAKGHSMDSKFDNDHHWTECARCDYTSEKVAHSKSEEGKCSCGFACADKCELCGKCEDVSCAFCADKCEFAVSDQIISFAPSTTLGAPEGPNGLAPGKDGAYLFDESITAQHVVLENGAFATVITLPNGTAAHSGISLLNNKNQDTYGKAGYNCGIPQLDGIANNIKLYFTNNGDSAVTFKYSAIDYYYDKGAVELTLAAGETKVVIMPATHTASVGLNHQIVFPSGADAGASITVWGEFIADQNLASVTVATPANQLRFGVGETFSAAGLVLKAHGTNYSRVYINGNCVVTNLDGHTFTASDVGTHTVFVMFGDVAVTYSITVDDHAHNVTYVEEQAPVQCEKDGLAAHYRCTVCNTMFADAYGNEIITHIDSVSCHTAPTSGILPGAAISCVHCGTAIGIASMDNWIHFAITTQTSKIGSNIVNGKLEHGYVNGIPGTKIYIGAGTKGATNDSEFYLKMSDNDSGWQTVIPNLGSGTPSGQLRKVILFYVNYSDQAVTMNLQNDAKGGNGKVTIPANGTAICEFTIKNSGGSNWFHYYVDSDVTTDVVLGVYGYFYVYNEEVDSISINKPATKLTYKVGESFTSEGLVVNVPITMSNSKTCYAQTGFTTNYDGRTFTADDIGIHTVTVTFGDNTTTYTIEVVPEVNCEGGEHKFDKVSDESLFVEMQGNNAIYKKACVYCGAASDETYVAETVAFVPHAANKDNYSVEYVILEDGRIAVKLTAKTDIAAGTSSSISTSINNTPSGTNVVFPVSGNGRRVYMEMMSNANVSITWQPEFYGDRDGVTMELVAGEAQSAVWVIKYDTKAGQTQAALPYEEFVFNTDVAAGTEIYITGFFYDRGDIIDVNVNTPAKQIIYKVGEKFSSEGFSFSVSSTDSLFAKVTIYNVTTNLDGKVFASDDLGVHKVIVSWGDFTEEYDILVIE